MTAEEQTEARKQPQRRFSAVRAVAKTMIAVGLILIGFVLYELWVTSYFARRAQGALQEQFRERAAAIELEAVPYKNTGDRPDAPFQVPADGTGPTETGVDGNGEAGDGNGAESVIVVEPAPLLGDAIGRLVIPRAGVDWSIVEGVERSDLRRAVGHMPGTAAPGQPGNAVLSGHRTTYGAPFYNLDLLETGDQILVETASGTHIYEVVDSLVVEPAETWVTGQWDGAWLTLTTCSPRFSASKRLVVVARLVAGPNAAAILAGL